MKDEDIQKAVEAISLIASAQATLVEFANASDKHTQLVLEEIVERCKAIKPSKRFNPDAQIDDELIRFVGGAIGFCAATNEEQHGVWLRLVDRRDPPVAWKQHGGIGVTIGYLDNRPVHVVLSHVDVAGFKVIFYEATSTVVDHEMVRQFIDRLAPESARRGDRINHTDATNMSNILPSGWMN
jgi:hypothetical protein